MIGGLFDEQKARFSQCLSGWVHIDKQAFLITYAADYLIQYPVKSDSLKYDAYSYYISRTIFFAEQFIASVKDIFEHPLVLNLCNNADSKTWFNLPSKNLFYYFDAFIMSLSIFSDKYFYKSTKFHEYYRKIHCCPK